MILGGVALPLGSALVSVGRFYTSPMIFAFDPFVGYFSGTLYDTVIDTGNALLTYRVGSLATLAGLAFVASVLTRDATGKLRFVQLRGPERVQGGRPRLALGALALLVSVIITWNGPGLGHWETADTIAAELGGARSGARCDVVYPESLLPYEASLLVKDCDEEVAAVEKTLGVGAGKGPARIRAFFFRDSGEKKRLMGAADTLIAKPWRREVYVQLSAYPHPVLGHELAHVIAGSFGRGPFRIAGSAGGLWPDPGLIEGIAVAASPDDDELSNAQWAHAMADLGSLPPMRQLFSLGFLNVAASKSYTLAGAFVRFALDRYGSDVVRAWYGGGSIEALTGKSWASLDEDFRAYVVATPLSPEAQSFAKARFDRAAVFGRKCPHVVDALRRKADQCRDAHEADLATVAYHDVLAHDPHDWGAMYGLGVVNLRYGDLAFGTATLTKMIDDADTPRTWRDRAKDALADGELLRGADAVAKAEYETLAAHSLEEDFARTEEVKALASTQGIGRAAIMAVLVGAPGRPADSIVGAEETGEWVATGIPLAAYMAGRQLVGREWYASAVPHLEKAIAGGAAMTPRVTREALRLRAVVACALGDRAGVARVRALMTAPDAPYSPGSGRRFGALRFIDRCSVSAAP